MRFRIAASLNRFEGEEAQVAPARQTEEADPDGGFSDAGVGSDQDESAHVGAPGSEREAWKDLGHGGEKAINVTPGMVGGDG